MGVVTGAAAPTPPFNGGTITTLLTDSPTSTTANDIFRAVAPTGYEAGSSVGAFYRAIAEDATEVLLVDTYGDLRFRAPAGQGAAQLLVASTDNGGNVVLSTSNGISYNPAGSAVFTVNPAGTVLTTPAAPATATLSTGTGAQLSTAYDVRSYTPVTFNPTAGASATCAVAISKDGTNYTALWTETEPAGVAFDGTIHGVNVYVPAAWKLRLTVVNATIGTTTYY